MFLILWKLREWDRICEILGNTPTWIRTRVTWRGIPRRLQIFLVRSLLLVFKDLFTKRNREIHLFLFYKFEILIFRERSRVSFEKAKSYCSLFSKKRRKDKIICIFMLHVRWNRLILPSFHRRGTDHLPEANTWYVWQFLEKKIRI